MLDDQNQHRRIAKSWRTWTWSAVSQSATRFNCDLLIQKTAALFRATMHSWSHSSSPRSTSTSTWICTTSLHSLAEERRRSWSTCKIHVYCQENFTVSRTTNTTPCSRTRSPSLATCCTVWVAMQAASTDGHIRGRITAGCRWRNSAGCCSCGCTKHLWRWCSALWVSSPTAVQWYQYFRDICSWKLLSSPTMLGGPGKTMQIDNSVMVKAKYHRGHQLRFGWVAAFGKADSDHPARCRSEKSRCFLDETDAITAGSAPRYGTSCSCMPAFWDAAMLILIILFIQHILDHLSLHAGYSNTVIGVYTCGDLQFVR